MVVSSADSPSPLTVVSRPAGYWTDDFDGGASMRFGLSLPIFDELADPLVLAELAGQAEAAGWDGVFVWDHLRYRAPARSATDPWIALAAMASRTRRVRLGPMVTPLARRRPQVVAKQLVALDQLSAGRVVMGVGLGLDTSGEEFRRFGEELDVRRRAEMLDEGLEVLRGLLSGREVDHHGAHFTVESTQLLPTPVQERLPIWVAGRWPNLRPVRRAARFEGMYVIDITPPELPALVGALAAERPGGFEGFDVVVHDVAGADPAPWVEGGATWLLTTFDAFAVTREAVSEAIAAGPLR
jgi:alkanesulfonate monooxygenase SsuD/methylene tetrahydromethanopterin reductase-like flavin-dependent oxidoreductase (luciferase family)